MRLPNLAVYHFANIVEIQSEIFAFSKNLTVFYNMQAKHPSKGSFHKTYSTVMALQRYNSN